MEFKAGDTAYLEIVRSGNSYDCELFKVQIETMSHNCHHALVKVFSYAEDTGTLRIVETRFLHRRRTYSRDKNEFCVGDMVLHRVDDESFMGPIVKVNAQTVNYLDTKSGRINRAAMRCVMVLSKAPGVT